MSISTTAVGPAGADNTFAGSNRTLTGLVLAVLTFWLFAQSALNIGPVMATDAGLPQPTMNTAISLAALFAGMFVVVAGGFADRMGRMKFLYIGLVINIAGSLLVGGASGGLAAPMMLGGRALQGLAAAFIMPTSLALVKTYWIGADRQRAVSMWSIGTFGGSGLAAIVGGFLAGTAVGWRGLFFLSAIVSILAMWLIRPIPESKPAADMARKLDIPGIASFLVALLTAQIIATQGSLLGWSSPAVLVLAVVCVISLIIFFRVESGNNNAFIDFRLFRSRSFSGAVLANFLMNSCIGVMTVALWMLQFAGGLSPTNAGYATLGYAVCVIAFIRVGEKLLQKMGPRKPMAFGAATMFVAIALLGFTNLYATAYIVLAAIGFSLFGLGLAFFATPATDTALSSLPEEYAGSGAGLFKMASSLGAAFGLAGSTSIFTTLQDNGVPWLAEAIDFIGRQDNVALREAGMVGIAFNAVLALIALVAILVIVPPQKRPADTLVIEPYPEKGSVSR